MRRAMTLLVGLGISAASFSAACGDDNSATPSAGSANGRDAAASPSARDGAVAPSARDAAVAGSTASTTGAASASGHSAGGLTLRADVQPVLRAQDALPSTFIPPYRSCVEPLDGKPGAGPDGKVCTNVAISGATEPGRYFPDYGSCDVVLTQRPFWSQPPAAESKPDDPRLDDGAYMTELAWVTQEIEAQGCVCCHDSKQLGKQAGEWDIRQGPLWLDSLSDSGLALFAGLADSSSLGAYAAEDNNGFERDLTGIMSTDGARMQKFMRAELSRRGISEAQARAVPPFGGPIYQNRITKPTACGPGEGVEPDGSVRFRGGPARYVYVGSAESDNPGVPPNLDRPAGTLFRLDVLASAQPVAAGFVYGTTPDGAFQDFPESGPAAALTPGQTYHLTVLRDVGLPIANCLFRFGDEVQAVPEKPAADAAAMPSVSADGGVAIASDAAAGAQACTLPGGDAQGWGAPCKESVDCTCAAAYCALQPGKTEGYCSKTGCKEDPGICPSDWTCFDVSQFAAGQPSICTK